MRRFGISGPGLDAAAERAAARYSRLDAARQAEPPYVESPDWLHLPLANYPDFANWQPFLDEIISHPAPDAFRAQHNFRATIDIPGFHVTSWFDIFQTSVIAAYQQIQARTGTQKLWIGPNEHYFVYADNFWPYDPYFDWFGYWLKDEPTPLIDEPPVFYSPRAWVPERSAYRPDDWRRAERWPPPGVTPLRLYLHGDGTLGDKPEGLERNFTYDPRRPVPSYGGRNMLIEPGSLDQQRAQAMSDYGLIYTGAPLQHPLTIGGNVRMTLHVGSDCPDTDFVAKLIELHPDGRAMLLMDGIVRAMYREPTVGPQPLSPGHPCQLTIDLGDIHHTFAAGSRIEVDVTSSNFPRHARNTNSGHPLLARDGDDAIRVAHNRVYHAAATPSFLELPLLRA